MMYLLNPTELETTNTEELKQLLKTENFGMLKFTKEIEVAGIPVTTITVEIKRDSNGHKPSKAGKVTTNLGITMPTGNKKGLRTAYKALTGEIKNIEYFELIEREY